MTQGQIAIYGAGALGRYVGSLLDCPLVFVDDTPQKQNTRIDNAPCLSVADYARQAPPNARLYSCIMQDGYDYFARAELFRGRYGLELLPFPPLLVSLGGGWHFYEPPQELEKKRARYEALERALADERSVACLRGHLRLRQTGDLRALVLDPGDDPCAHFARRLPKNINFVDIGAYDGDTIAQNVYARGAVFGGIWAVEPDAQNADRLRQRFLQTPLQDKITIVNAAVSDEGGLRVGFAAAGKMSSKISKNEAAQTQTVTIEGLNVPPPVFYKTDIEGDDVGAVLASLAYFRRVRPFLELSAYHYPDDLLQMFEALQPLNYDFYLRCYSNDGFDLRLQCAPRPA